MRVRGLEFNVIDSGGRHDRLPFVWAHPLTSSIAAEDRHGVFDWSEVRGERRWIRYDARGHGGSAQTRHAADYRWPNLAHDQLELMDTLEVDRVVLGGASMGAATALHSACFQPDRVSALVLVIPPAAWDTRHESSKKYRSSARYTMTHGVHGLAKATRKQPSPTIFTDRLAPLQGGGIGAIDDLHYLSAVAALRGAAGSDLPMPAQLARIRDVPTLILSWETDSAHPVSTAERLAAGFEHADLHVATTADEVAHWPEEVAHFLHDCE